MEKIVFNCKSLEKDFLTIPEMSQAESIDYELKEWKDRYSNRIWELTLSIDDYGIFDTYTYYREDLANGDIKALEDLDIEMIEA